MLGACGIDCSVCDIHLAPENPEIAEKLVKIFVNMGYKDAKPEWFHCQGCSGDRNEHWSSNCQIMECCFDKKHLENCSQCSEFVCDRLDKFADDGFGHHKEAVERLKKMKKGSKNDE